MKRNTCEPGYTTPELIVVLTLLAVLLGLSVPSFVNALDVLAVRGAREVVVAAAVHSRALAMARGGAFLRIAETGVVEVLHRDTVQLSRRWDLADRYGVAVQIQNSTRTVALLEFDALGIGRLANLTVHIRRRQVESTVTFSAYGRARTW